MRPIKTLLLRVIAIAVAFIFGLQAQEIKQGGYRSAQLKVTAGGAGWDFDTGNLIQLVLTDAKGNAESSGEYLTVGNDSPMPIKVSSKRVGIQNVEIGPGERRRFKIQGYRRPNSQYSEFNSTVPVGIVYWSGPSPQETQQAVQAKAQKESDAKARQERKAQEAQRTREAEEQAKKDEWTRNAQKHQDDQAARARAAAEESRRQWELSQQRAKAQRDGIAALGQMINKTLADKAIREQQERIRTNLKALESGTLIRCDSCGGSGYAECQQCGGEGVEECSLCSGRGEVGFGRFANKCTMCGGGGKSSCSTCQGTGRVDCRDCAGQGSNGTLKDPNRRGDAHIGYSPRSAKEVFNLAKGKYDAGDFEGAISDYSEIIRLNPGWADAWAMRGAAKHGKGDIDGAIADTSEAVRLNPGDSNAWSNLGGFKALKRDFNGAISDASAAIRLNPQLAAAWSNRGAAKERMSDLEGALADFSEAIRLYPRNSEGWSNRAIVKNRKGDLEGAIADHSIAFEIHRDSQTAGLIAATYWRSGDLQRGLDWARKSTALDPKNQYAALYEFILSARINKGIRSTDREALAMGLRNADTKWPSRLLEHFAYPGKSQLSPPMSKGDMPDYYFYLGQEALIAGDRAKAASQFKQAADGPVDDTSTILAKAELHRLK